MKLITSISLALLATACWSQSRYDLGSNYIYGTLPLAKGGTGYSVTTIPALRTYLGISSTAETAALLALKADAAATTASLALKAPIANPTFTGTVTGTFSGALTGNVTGNVTGSSGSTTGNAATATTASGLAALGNTFGWNTGTSQWDTENGVRFGGDVSTDGEFLGNATTATTATNLGGTAIGIPKIGLSGAPTAASGADVAALGLPLLASANVFTASQTIQKSAAGNNKPSFDLTFVRTNGSGGDVTGRWYLDGYGSLTADMPVIGPNGALGTPSFGLGGGSVGLFRPAVNTIGFQTSSLERARVDSAGNFGIGASAPGSLLSVGGTTGNLTVDTTGNLVTSGTVTSPSIDYEQSPASHGFLAWTYPCTRFVVISALTRDSYILLEKIWIPKTITVTGIKAYCAATLLTNEDNYNGFGLYSATGVLIAKSADQATAWKTGANTLKSATLTAEAGQSLTITGGPGVYVYGAILANTNGGTTPSWAYSTTSGPLYNAGQVGTAGASTLTSAYVASQTALVDLSSTALSADNYTVWMGLY